MDNSNLISIEAVEAHLPLWQSTKNALSRQILPQALLLLGPKHTQMLNFAYRWVASVFCSDAAKPCGQCNSCLAIQEGMHPDLSILTKEEGSSVIKIEQIRILQETIYHTPSWQKFRFVLIYPLDALNLAASNALLKILEEPPSHVKFILISEDYDVLPTLKSRCQRLFFHGNQSFFELHQNYFNLSSHYPENSVRYALSQEQDKLSLVLKDILLGKTHPCEAALVWQKVHLDDFLWFIYLFLANAIAQIKLGMVQTEAQAEFLVELSRQFRQPNHLYLVLDKVVHLMTTLKQNITLNHDLVVESVLLNFVEVSDASSPRL